LLQNFKKHFQNSKGIMLNHFKTCSDWSEFATHAHIILICGGATSGLDFNQRQQQQQQVLQPA
jgi:hypothetical protein